MIADHEACYVISVAARILGLHAQTLRYYERAGLVQPGRTQGNIRLYSDKDIQKLKQIQRLIGDLGVNLAGVEVIMHMADHMAELEERIGKLEAENERLRIALGG